jgi:NAD(P)-dependent dehydrogenase (short-subunit alcohol dehydrogenase family)
MSILDRFSLKDKVIILTGGAGLYGRSLTTALAESGARLVIASRDLVRLEEIAAEENRKGHSVRCEQLDQGDEQSVLQLKERVLRDFGQVDGLVNNAVLRPMKTLDGPVAAWEESMRVNATGLFLMSRVFGEVMSRRKTGAMVNISSIQGVIGPSMELYAGVNMVMPPPDYFFHKGGMVNLTRYFAGIYGPAGVRVNSVTPGGFFSQQPEPFLSRYCEHTMLGRMADDDDLGAVIVFLLSDAARYITGANLPVDGGYTAK